MARSKTASKKATKSADAKAAGRTARGQRAIQAKIDRKDRRKPKAPERKPAMQAGARRQPVRMPAQHIAKPGHEHALDLAPRFEAPDYRGSGKLEGMKAIVTGADSGIGRAVAVLFAREGADVAILYLDEHDDAKQTARLQNAGSFTSPGTSMACRPSSSTQRAVSRASLCSLR